MSTVAPHSPRFSVAVLHRRPGAYLAECLERLVPQVRDAGEIVVLTEERGKAAEARAACERLPAARVVVSSAVESRRKNAAFEATTGDLVLLLDAACYVNPGCVAALRAFAERQEDVAAVGALLLGESGWPRRSYLIQPRIRPGRGLLRRFTCLVLPRHRHAVSLRLEPAGPRRVDALRTVCVLWRREAWRQGGGFPEGYRFGFDDLALAAAVRRRGWASVLLPRSRAFLVTPRLHRRADTATRLAYEASLSAFVRRHRGRAFAAAFGATRRLRAAAACAVAWPFVLAPGRFPAQVHALRTNAALLRPRWSGQEAVEDDADSESVLPWETEPWCAT